MRGRRPWALGVLVTLGLAGTLAACGQGTSSSQKSGCRPGGAPTQRYGERPQEESLRYATQPVVIGCASLPSGRRLELVAYQLGAGNHTDLCIDHYDLDAGNTWGCGSNSVFGGGAIDVTATHRSAGSPDLIAGALSPAVGRVVVRFEVRGRLGRRLGRVVTVRRRRLLRRIAVDRRFGRYFAELPERARAVTAEALGPHGRPLGLAFAQGFRGPVGEARLCYSRPRIVRLALLDAARANRPNRLRAWARYPGGSVRSIEARLRGKRAFRADVKAHAPRPGHPQRITLPVVLGRAGTIGIDVTIGGVPRSARCGDRPVHRRSEARTLVVRVRGASPG